MKYKSIIPNELKEEFDSIYEKLYDNYIFQLEKMRKKSIFRTIIIYILAFIVLVMLIEMTKREGNSQIFILVFAMIGFIIELILGVKNAEHNDKYIQFYRDTIIPNFIKLINNKLEYNLLDDEKFSMERDYIEAEFDKESFNKYVQNDYVEGFIENETFIKICNLNLLCRYNRYYIDIFRGNFVQAKISKKIGTYIKISRNNFFKKPNKIEINNDQFEKYFDVYAENETIAKQLLTSDIMECLIDFHKKYAVNLEIVLKNNNIYIRFFKDYLFYPKIFNNSKNKQLLMEYFCILKFIEDICKKINKTLQ